MEEDRLEKFEWSEFLTPQEDELRGAGIERKYQDKWYTPYIIQDGSAMDINTINQIRQRRPTYMTAQLYWIDEQENQPDGEVKTRLSPLDPETGETLHDPTALDERLRINSDTEAYSRLRT
jgi:hypothetical protein